MRPSGADHDLSLTDFRTIRRRRYLHPRCKVRASTRVIFFPIETQTSTWSTSSSRRMPSFTDAEADTGEAARSPRGGRRVVRVRRGGEGRPAAESVDTAAGADVDARPLTMPRGGSGHDSSRVRCGSLPPLVRHARHTRRSVRSKKKAQPQIAISNLWNTGSNRSIRRRRDEAVAGVPRRQMPE